MRRVFGVDYAFLSCGDVFTRGLQHAAESVGIAYEHAPWDAADLPQRVTAFMPDLLFVVHGRNFARLYPNANFNCNTAVWLLDEPYEVDDTSNFSRLFHHVFVNDPSTLHRHSRSSYLPVCYDPVIHKPVAGVKTQQVGFVGGGNGRRERVLGALARAKLLSYVVGGWWSDPAVNAVCLSDNIPPTATAALYASTRIVVNVFREQHHYNAEGIEATALNPRIYEALACGALVVSEWRREIATLVPDLPTFRSEPECVAVVERLLANPNTAEAIRVKCVERLAFGTYAARLSTVLESVREAAA